MAMTAQEKRLRAAIRKDRPDLALEAIRDGADPMARAGDGWRHFHLAIVDGKAKCCQAMLDAGANPHADDWNSGFTALMLAADHGEEAICQSLLAAGARVEDAQGLGLTALHLAAREGHASVCQALIAAGARVDGPAGGCLWTPLHLAASFGHPEACRALARAGASLDEKTRQEGLTPLHYAAQKGSGAACEALLAAGARPDLVNKAGKTPLDVAWEMSGNGRPNPAAAVIQAAIEKKALQEEIGRIEAASKPRQSVQPKARSGRSL